MKADRPLTEYIDQGWSGVPRVQFRTVLPLCQIDSLHGGDRNECELVQQEASRLQEWLQRFLNFLETILRPVDLSSEIRSD